MRTSLLAFGGLVLFGLAFSPLLLQAQEGEREPVSHQHVISGTPLVLLAGWFNAEYERKLSESTTVGITGGWLNLDEDDYTNVSGFLRYYPQFSAFTGFYIGGQAGIHRVDEFADSEESSHTAFGVGLDVGYSWLLGPGRSFYVGLGIGGVRLFGDFSHASKTIPSLRLLSVGVAF
jgi:hypothetical protein